MVPLDRSGFTLLELLVSMVLVAIVGSVLTGLLTSQLTFQRVEDAMRDSRSTARSALNVLTSDMRMLEAEGAVAAAGERDITIRVPYSFGVVCASSGAATDVSVLPADSTTYAGAGFSGWAWRSPSTGSWTYLEGVSSTSEPGTANCDAASVEVLDSGRVVRFDPGVAGLAVGTPVLLFQRIRYHFGESNLFDDRDGLFRTIVETGNESELVAPFTSDARFRFHVDWSSTAQEAVPADLSDIVGLEIVLDAESVADSPRLDAPEPFTLNTSIYFKNVSN